MRRVTRALLSNVCRVSTARGSRALRFSRGDYIGIKKAFNRRVPGVMIVSPSFVISIKFAIMSLHLVRRNARITAYVTYYVVLNRRLISTKQ